MTNHSFATAVNCLDGRVQQPVIAYLTRGRGVAFVDMITEPGPNAIPAANTDAAWVESIRARVRVSVERHGSRHVAVVERQ